MNTIDPNQVFESLTENTRPQKRKNLSIVHQICSELHRLGSKDFSLATVGRMSEERSGISQRALYNVTSNQFKTLIRAWADFSTRSVKPIARSKRQEAHQDDNDLLKKIDDPALRTLLGCIIAERDRLRSEVKLLRNHVQVVIDRRVLPGHIDVTPSGQVIQVMNSIGLSDTEKHALSQAILEKFLDQEGWSEGPNGEILNTRGRKLFDIGFTNAIRKILS